MRLFITLSTSTLLVAGCIPGIHTAMCIDSKIPRPIYQDEGVHSIEFKYSDQPKIERNIQCESYFDAQCSTRGNYRTWREVGRDSQYQEHTIQVQDSKLGKVEIPLPLCNELVKREKVKPPQNIRINGETYFHLSSANGLHTYKPSGFGVTESQHVMLSYTLAIKYVPSTK